MIKIHSQIGIEGDFFNLIKDIYKTKHNQTKTELQEATQ